MSAFNLSLDDFSPYTNAGLDFGSIDVCDKLIAIYPDIKINLFVPSAYCRLNKDPAYLSKHLDWVNKVNSLGDNYRVNLHGHYHRRVSSKYGNSNNDEWQYLKYSEAKLLANVMTGEFKKAGLSFTPTFRGRMPPHLR